MGQQEIVLVDDDPAILELQLNLLEIKGQSADTFTDPFEAWERIQKGRTKLLVTDWEMPGLSGLDLLFRTHGVSHPPRVILLTGHGTVDRAVQAMSVGAYHFLEKPFAPEKYLDLVTEALSAPSGNGTSNGKRSGKGGPIVASEIFRRVLARARAAADTDATVLLLGESGVGKEVVADLIHANSSRSKGPIVKVNCGALPDHLIESELFGHEKGAFTGADRRRVGRFEQADGGTLLLDEIGDLPLPLQVKLLRALQERTIERVGGSGPIKVDFRLICATHRDLQYAVEQHQFREDLYYRVNVVPIRIPPLRERPEDIEPLANHFLKQLAKKCERPIQGFHPSAVDRLCAFPWPGNIRQLRNAVEYAMIMSQGPMMEVKHLPEELKGAADRSGFSLIEEGLSAAPAKIDVPDSLNEPMSLEERLKQYERQVLAQTLARHTWNVKEVATELGVSRSTLYEKLKAHGLRKNGGS